MLSLALLLSLMTAPAAQAAGAAPPGPAATQTPPDQQALARAIFSELVGMDTSHETGDTTRAARALARRFTRAGFAGADVRVLGPSPKKQNLVVRLRAASPGRKPLLLLGHLDVVQALRGDWSHRSLQAHGEGRLLLRPGHPGHEGAGGDLGEHPAPPQT